MLKRLLPSPALTRAGAPLAVALVVAGALAGAVAPLAAGTAAAAVVELGQTKSSLVAPTCPKGTSTSNCRIVLERTTAIQTQSDGVANPMVVRHSGWIVAFTVGVSRLSSNNKTVHNLLHGLDTAYGGTPQIALSVLAPGPKNSYTLKAQSGSYHLIPFLGRVLTEPLSLPNTFKAFTALPVRKGDVIALTTPTWAPVLTYNLTGSAFAYRQSRASGCTSSPGSQTAQLKLGSTKQYQCSYTGTRVEYSATEITNTPYPKHYPH